VTGGGLQATPQNYVSLANLIDPTKPDVRDLYVQTYGDQGITGFLELTGAKKNAGSSDKVEWYEEGRLHKTFNGTYDADGAVSGNGPGVGELTSSITPAAGNAGTVQLRLGDVILTSTGLRLVVTSVKASTSTVADLYNVTSLNGTAGSDIGTAEDMAIIGNTHAQGTDQPGSFYQTGLVKRENPYVIVKEMYEVNGSQATNIGWLNVNGQYMWYLKNEMDARKRFMNEREMMLLYSQKGDIDVNDGTGTAQGIAGSEGYFAAVEDRGITTSGTFDAGDFTDLDALITELDKEGAPGEYAMYLNRTRSLAIDDLLATGLSASGGLTGQFGAFNNDQQMAINLGFKSFTRGGYTFHKHDWKLLNDPTLGAIGDVSGAMIPLAQVADAQSGVKAPALEMNYKAAGNYSREMEHWVEGGGVLGHVTSGKDTVKFNYRSECNLVTRAANQHILLK
jgi:hypothetical protein